MPRQEPRPPLCTGRGGPAGRFQPRRPPIRPSTAPPPSCPSPCRTTRSRWGGCASGSTCRTPCTRCSSSVRPRVPAAAPGPSRPRLPPCQSRGPQRLVPSSWLWKVPASHLGVRFTQACPDARFRRPQPAEPSAGRARPAWAALHHVSLFLLRVFGERCRRGERDFRRHQLVFLGVDLLRRSVSREWVTGPLATTGAGAGGSEGAGSWGIGVALPRPAAPRWPADLRLAAVSRGPFSRPGRGRLDLGAPATFRSWDVADFGGHFEKKSKTTGKKERLSKGVLPRGSRCGAHAVEQPFPNVVSRWQRKAVPRDGRAGLRPGRGETAGPGALSRSRVRVPGPPPPVQPSPSRLCWKAAFVTPARLRTSTCPCPEGRERQALRAEEAVGAPAARAPSPRPGPGGHRGGAALRALGPRRTLLPFPLCSFSLISWPSKTTSVSGRRRRA